MKMKENKDERKSGGNKEGEDNKIKGIAFCFICICFVL